MAISGFQDLLDDGSLISSETQLHVQDVVGDPAYSGHFNVDLTTQEIVFTGTDQLRAGVQFLGSAATGSSTAEPNSGSWLWGWANVSGVPDAALRRVSDVRAFGERYGVPELTTAELPLSDSPRHTAGLYALVSSLINGRLPYYTAAASRGTVVALLIEHPDFALRPPDTPRLMTVLQSTVSEGLVRDWRRALNQYAAFRGLTCSERPGGVVLTGPTIDEVSIDLDQLGRVSGMSSTVTPR